VLPVRHEKLSFHSFAKHTKTVKQEVFKTDWKTEVLDFVHQAAAELDKVSLLISIKL